MKYHGISTPIYNIEVIPVLELEILDLPLIAHVA